MVQAGSYSFKDVFATIVGPGGSITFSGEAEEGYVISFANDKVTTMIGAGGDGMHSVHADQSGTITFNLLKTSPVNRQLQTMYDYQNVSASRAGRNTITIRDTNLGDSTVGIGAAFRKFPDIGYGTNGATQSWAFNVIVMNPKLGDGGAYTPAGS